MEHYETNILVVLCLCHLLNVTILKTYVMYFHLELPANSVPHLNAYHKSQTQGVDEWMTVKSGEHEDHYMNLGL